MDQLKVKDNPIVALSGLNSRYSLLVQSNQNISLQRSLLSREKFVRYFIILIVVVPIILDFFFIGTAIPRYSRIIAFIVISGILLLDNEKFLNTKPIGMDIILIVVLLYSIGTFSSLLSGGVATPNFLSLLLMMIIAAYSQDLRSIISSTFGICAHFLIVLSVIAIVLKVNHLGIVFTDYGYPVFLKSVGNPGRNYGIFAHPNVLGSVSVISFLYILTSKSRKIHKLSIVLPIFCILKCGSRTSIIGLVSGIIIYFLLRSQFISNSKQKIKFDFPLIIGLFLLGIFWTLISFFIRTINYLNPESLTSRVSIWQISLELARSHPFIGLGWGWQTRAVESQFLNSWEASAHNQILEIQFSSGMLGLFLFVILIIIGLFFFSEMPILDKTIFISTLISGISESYLDLQYPNTLTFLFLTILIQAKSRSR